MRTYLHYKRKVFSICFYKTIFALALIVCCLLTGAAQQPSTGLLKAKLIDAQTGTAISFATVTAKLAKLSAVTNEQGFFSLRLSFAADTLAVTHTAYETLEIAVEALRENAVVEMQKKTISLQEVVVNTGYQVLPKERATGSFARIDNALFNRQVSTDIMSRLEGLSTSLLFDRRANPNSSSGELTIRGASTIMAIPSPLIVVDNFPYEGDISTINPNDVESITLLKDAAAASIWGARAGNGVIVVTTKRGRLRQPMRVTYNQNVTAAQKPDVFYNPDFLNAADFIEVEKFLFGQNYYAADETSPLKPVLSPVVELLIQQRDGTITQAEADAKINALKMQDVRNDFARFLYQPAVNSQLNINVSGGGNKHHAYLSAGYDANRETLKGNKYNRFTLNSANSYFPAKGLELSGAVVYTQTLQDNNGLSPHLIRTSPSKLLYPYASFTDANGEPAALTHYYRASFVAEAPANGLLNWAYKPLQELEENEYHVRQHDVRLQAGLKYAFAGMFSVDLKYQYQRLGTRTQLLYGEESFYTRDLINQYTYTGTGGTLVRPVPPGAIVVRENDEVQAQAGRAQLNFNHNRKEHRVHAIAGMEVRETKTLGDNYMLYGFDRESQTAARMDYVSFFTAQPSGYSDVLLNGISNSSLLDRNVSFFSNAAYTFRNRYTVSASARTDGSNLYGVKTNQQFVPLWSAGASWLLSDEAFYKISWLPYLKLRATYGFAGNSYKNASAYVTAAYRTDNLAGGISATIQNPPNPFLRWEKVATFNAGVDFETKNKRISGSLEYFEKHSTDLISNLPLDPTTGFFVASRYSYVGNGASMQGRGVDMEINTINTTGLLQWHTTLLFSYANNRVTYYPFTQTPNSYFGRGVPLEGKPLNGMYSYPWAGLNPQNGDPQFILNGVKTMNYDSVATNLRIEDLLFHGSAIPTFFGAVRNTLQWKGFSLSANVIYRLGYYFKRSSIDYKGLYGGWQGHADFARRWKQPGDEQFTQVPSMPATTVFSSNRDNHYLNSSALVEKGDHIRLQDINLSYTLLGKQAGAKWLQEVQVYSLLSNVGILWRANKAGLDPDYNGATAYYPPLRTISVGVKCIF
ncbi:SusC/RagA family TonB-linked outer membrane protein [Lacibacter sp.]|uniref:SusC/RagA family TonB-linked outer membrane protein n=1 Tax=Lacibacter sp. TaxID=1915409 RepID=UPI002B4B0A5B|nr:SusC/RagA family TonB-linked outer membrane protein [Lacibacter sp.]HLP37724.1 SusC/RagA family TonB-linked outer membrane protein [Lacibacter sp.]